MPQWGERRHTLEQLNRELPGLNHRSKIGLGRSMNADLRRPHTMASMGTESDLSHRRVVPVLGAQFRSRPTSSGDDRSSMQGSASCPGCAALNSKLHKNHKQLAELAELRSREKEARALAERCKEREAELEEGWLRVRVRVRVRANPNPNRAGLGLANLNPNRAGLGLGLGLGLGRTLTLTLARTRTRALTLTLTRRAGARTSRRSGWSLSVCGARQRTACRRRARRPRRQTRAPCGCRLRSTARGRRGRRRRHRAGRPRRRRSSGRRRPRAPRATRCSRS